MIFVFALFGSQLQQSLDLAPLAGQFQQSLDSVLDDRAFQGAMVSARVEDQAGIILYDRSSNIRVIPASNEKLVTCAFAFDKLSARYRPETRLWRAGDKIFVETNGNPMLTYSELLAASKKLGRVNTVLVKESYRPLFFPEWKLSEIPNKYAAAVSAFTVDRASFEIWADAKHPYFVPANYGTKIVTRRKSGSRFFIYDPILRTAELEGDLPKSPTRIDTLGLAEPDRAAATILGRSFELTDHVPRRPPDLVLRGPDLSTTLTECLQKSDNNLAEQLLLLAAQSDGALTKEPYEAAVRDLIGWLAARNPYSDDFHPRDGSGLSRENLVTTRGLVGLLRWELGRPTADRWLAMLAKPGAGTLKGRLQDVEIVGKTGTLNMVVALSGYVRTKTRGRLIFSVIANNFACPEADAKKVLDKFARILSSD